MPLTNLGINNTRVFDLKPLKDMKSLTNFNCVSSLVADFTPLKNMPLVDLRCSDTPVSSLGTPVAA